MSAALTELQREVSAFAKANPASSDDVVGWLQAKRQDAVDDWRRLRKRVADEGLSDARLAKEVEFLEKKYSRYFQSFGRADLDDTSTAPWKDDKEKTANKLPRDEVAKKCLQPHCRRPLPIAGASIQTAPPQCGVCSAAFSPQTIERLLQDREVMISCEKCGSELCITCGRDYSERECRTCHKVVGLPPSEKLAQAAVFSCWVCETEQHDRRKAKIISAQAKGSKKETFRCGECATRICIECAKPVTCEFEPDYGFVRNWWYKFVDNIWDPPGVHGGFEKYLRRERRLGIPQFSLEALYTPPHKLDLNDQDTSLYDFISSSLKKEQAAETEMEEDQAGDEPQVAADTLAKEPPFQKPKKRSLENRGRDYRVRQVAFGREVPPPQGFDDFWYAENNHRLYQLACNWAETYFGKRDFPRSYDEQTWLSRFNDQFIQYANIVAHEDPFFGPEFGGKRDGWEHIVRCRRNRKWLIVAVLAQIIEKKIYVDLLFGATPEQAKKLEQQDSDNIRKDGYERAAARAQSINLMLGNRVVPAHFYQKVDELTCYAANIFQDIFALTNVLEDGAVAARQDDAQRQKRQKRQTRREDDLAFMYSELHFIIAHAAYFHVCMRRSSSIFHFISATPAARMDYPVEGQACYELYRASKGEAERREAAKSKEEKAALKQLEGQEGVTKEELAAASRARRFDQHHRLRGAKIKFAVWPMITRYRAENVGQPVIQEERRRRGRRQRSGSSLPLGDAEDDFHWHFPTPAEIESGEGQRIVEIGKCVVVYYQGIIYPRSTTPGYYEADGSNLLSYLANTKPAKTTHTWRHVSRIRYVSRLLLLAVVMFLWQNRYWFIERWSQVVLSFLSLAAGYALIAWSAGDQDIANALPQIGRGMTGVLILLLLSMLGTRTWNTNLCGLWDNLHHLVIWRWPIGAVSTLAGLVHPRSRNLTTTALYTSALSWCMLWAYKNHAYYAEQLYWDLKVAEAWILRTLEVGAPRSH